MALVRARLLAIGCTAVVAPVWVAVSLLSGPLASAAQNSLQQECIEAATARPRIEHAEMTKAGTGEQFAYAHVLRPELPSECADRVLRKEKFLFKVQNPIHRARWETAMRLFETFSIGNDGHMTPVYTQWDYAEGPGLYRCTPGPKSTGAKLEIKLIAQDPETKTPLAKKTYTTLIHKILPKRC